MSVARAIVLGLGVFITGLALDTPETAADSAIRAQPGMLYPAADRPRTDKEKCKALNRCRYHYTKCANALERDPDKNWNNNQRECIDPYQKYIHANFQGFDFFFHRWFNPTVLDCDTM